MRLDGELDVGTKSLPRIINATVIHSNTQIRDLDRDMQYHDMHLSHLDLAVQYYEAGILHNTASSYPYTCFTTNS
eukprot:SAG31_NODE_4749_length_2981_cov_10.758501_2_plen_75_part_00